jgi:excinuclease UvrABC ATPase subunit
MISLFAGTAALAQQFKYIGADKCKMCHNKPATGDQYKQWVDSKHSQALKSLNSEAAWAYAKKNNIADPTKEPKCLKCHSTYHSVAPAQIATLLPTEGVSCESCHGPGSMYKSPAIMKVQAQSIKNGLIIPNEETCKKCHNKENPFYKPFDFAAAWPKVNHPNPAIK